MITYILATLGENTKEQAEMRRYTLTDAQAVAAKELLQCINTPEVPSEERQAALLHLTYTLVAHDFDEADIWAETHPIIAVTILHNIHAGNIFASPDNVSPYLATVQHIMRTTIMLKIYEHAKVSRSTTQPPTAFPSHKNVKQAMRDELKWIKEEGDTPFGWVKSIMHLAAGHVAAGSRMPRFMWTREDDRAFRFDGYRIDYDSIINLMQSSTENLRKKFVKLWTAYGIPLEMLVNSTSFSDDLGNQAEHYNFLRFGPNQALRDRADEIEKLIFNNKKTCKKVTSTKGEKLYFNHTACRDLLELSEEFMKDASGVMYLTGGQPPRGTELLAAHPINIPTRPRNTYIINDHFVLVGFLNKTTFIHNKDKPIPRAYPFLLSCILINYLAFIRPIEYILTRHALQLNSKQAKKCQTNLFFVNGRELETKDLTAVLKYLTELYFGLPKGLGTAEMRHVLIYFGMRDVRTEKDTEADRSLLDLQAGHVTEIAKRYYGVELGRFPGNIDPELIELFMKVSFAHHKVYNIHRKTSILGHTVSHSAKSWQLCSWKIATDLGCDGPSLSWQFSSWIIAPFFSLLMFCLSDGQCDDGTRVPIPHLIPFSGFGDGCRQLPAPGIHSITFLHGWNPHPSHPRPPQFLRTVPRGVNGAA